MTGNVLAIYALSLASSRGHISSRSDSEHFSAGSVEESTFEAALVLPMLASEDVLTS